MALSKNNSKLFDPFSKEDLALLTQMGKILQQNGMKNEDFRNYLQSYSKEKLHYEQLKISKENNQNTNYPQGETKSDQSYISSKAGERERYSEVSTTQSSISTQKINKTPAAEVNIEPRSSKDIVLTMTGAFAHTSVQINKLLKESDNKLSKEELQSLSALNITLEKLNRDLESLAQKSEIQLQSDLESTRQLKEHEEKQKGFMNRLKEGGKEVADTLASFLLPERWYEMAKEREADLAVAKSRGSESKDQNHEKNHDRAILEKESRHHEIDPHINEKVGRFKKGLESHSFEPATPSIPITKELEEKRNRDFTKDITPGKSRS